MTNLDYENLDNLTQDLFMQLNNQWTSNSKRLEQTGGGKEPLEIYSEFYQVKHFDPNSRLPLSIVLAHLGESPPFNFSYLKKKYPPLKKYHKLNEDTLVPLDPQYA